mgnify:CR=1 FL=1
MSEIPIQIVITISDVYKIGIMGMDETLRSHYAGTREEAMRLVEQELHLLKPPPAP